MKLRNFGLLLMIFLSLSFISASSYCSETDAGLDIYNKGSVTVPGESMNDYCNMTTDDILIERICDENNQAQDVAFSCPNGCSSGACIQREVGEPAPSCPENWKIRATNFGLDYGTGKDYVDIERYVNGNWEMVCSEMVSEEECYIGNLEFIVSIVNEQQEVVTLTLDSPSEFDYKFNDIDDEFVVLDSENIDFDRDTDEYLVASYCKPEPETCTDTDGGKNYYKFGVIDPSAWGEFEDQCLDVLELLERSCNPTNPDDWGTNYNCPNGCANSACREVTEGTCQESAIRISDWDQDGDDYEIDLEVLDGGAWTTLCSGEREGGECDYKEISIKVESISYYPKWAVLNILNDGVFYTHQNAFEGNLANLSDDDFLVAKWCDGVVVEENSTTETNLTSPTCTDSDGGLNYYIKGNVNYSKGVVSDGCIVGGDHEGWLREITCNGDNMQMNDYNCPNGCRDGACIPVNAIDNQTNTNETSCSSGCLFENDCVSVGFRVDNSYCRVGGIFYSQLNESNSCENDFECSSNSCIDDVCVKKGFWTKLFEWLNRLFGGD
jgi:hypothetical protein